MHVSHVSYILLYLKSSFGEHVVICRLLWLVKDQFIDSASIKTGIWSNFKHNLGSFLFIPLLIIASLLQSVPATELSGWLSTGTECSKQHRSD